MNPAEKNIVAGSGVGKKKSYLVWPLVVALSLIFFAFITPIIPIASAQNDVIAKRDFDFINSLIDSALIDLAEERLNMLDSGNISPQMKKDLTLLRVRVNVIRAKQTEEPATQVELLEAAIKKYDEYLAATDEKQPNYKEALFGKAQTKNDLAKSYLEWALKDPKEGEVARKKAMSVSEESLKFYTEFSEKLEEELGPLRDIIYDEDITGPEKEKAKRKFDKIYPVQRNTDKEISALYLWRINLFPANSKERFEFMRKAVEKMTDLKERHSEVVEGLIITLNLAQVEAERLSGDYNKFFNSDPKQATEEVSSARDELMYSLIGYILMLQKMNQHRAFYAWTIMTKAEVLASWKFWKPSPDFESPDGKPFKQRAEYLQKYAEAQADFKEFFKILDDELKSLRDRKVDEAEIKRIEGLYNQGKLKYIQCLVEANNCGKAVELCQEMVRAGGPWKVNAQNLLNTYVAQKCPITLDALGFLEKGKSQLRQKKYTLAIESFKNAIKTATKDETKTVLPMAYAYLGRTFFIIAYNKYTVNKENPELPKSFALVREAFNEAFKLLTPDEASKDKDLKDTMKSIAELYFHAALLEYLSTKDKNDPAILKVLEEGTVIYKKWDSTANVDFTRASVLEKAGRYTEAIKSYEEFVKNNKAAEKYPDAIIGIARCWFFEAWNINSQYKEKPSDAALKKRKDEAWKKAEEEIKNAMEIIKVLPKLSAKKRESSLSDLTAYSLRVNNALEEYDDVIKICDTMLASYEKDPTFFKESILKITEQKFYAQLNQVDKLAEAKAEGKERNMFILEELHKKGGAADNYIILTEIVPEDNTDINIAAYKMMTITYKAVSELIKDNKTPDRKALDPYIKKCAKWTLKFYEITYNEPRGWPFNPATISGYKGPDIADDKPYLLQRLRYVEDRLCWEGYYPRSVVGDEAVMTVNPDDNEKRIEILRLIVSMMDKVEPPNEKVLRDNKRMLEPMSDAEAKVVLELRKKYESAVDYYFGTKEIAKDFTKVLRILKSVKKDVVDKKLIDNLIKSPEFNAFYKAAELRELKLTYQEYRLLALYRQLGRLREAGGVIEDLQKYYGSDELLEELAYIWANDDLLQYDDASKVFNKKLLEGKDTRIPIDAYSTAWFRFKYMYAYCEYKAGRYAEAVAVINEAVTQFRGTEEEKKVRLEGKLDPAPKPNPKDSKYKKGSSDIKYIDDLELWTREHKRVKWVKHNFFDLINTIKKDNNVPAEVKKGIKG